MILILEQDTRPHGGRRFTWRPGLWRGVFAGRRAWRVWWGLWSLSCYGSPGLRDFMNHVEAGNTRWEN